MSSSSVYKIERRHAPVGGHFRLRSSFYLNVVAVRKRAASRQAFSISRLKHADARTATQCIEYTLEKPLYVRLRLSNRSRRRCS
ncbi:hypothetical protein B1812_17135 [Methylocystis bryophila]|uniref:Uncharacterized protein n=1 Tax=Methylocystis bryophila TaxID=655015 RepID=A0A1W6MY58_9HYPH|nr:hypothetical protein B1812_17135 [Methylocystis bryophila]